MKDTQHLSTSKKHLGRAAAKALFLIVAAKIASGCQREAPTTPDKELATALALSAYAPKDRRLVLWSRDSSGGLASHWIAGNDDDIRVIASGPGLLIPWGNSLWLYETPQTPVDLCDCAAESTKNDINETVSDDEVCESVTTVFVQTSRLRNIITDEIVPIDAPVTDSSRSLTKLKFTSRPTSSIGRYLIVDQKTEARYCGGEPSRKTQGFSVVDLETGVRTELFSEAELEDIEEHEKEAALALVREGHVALASDAWELELTAVAPRVTRDGLLTLAYEFSAQTTPVDSGENWQVYTHSVWVPAHKIPDKLSDFVIISPLVHMFVALFPQIDVRGFFEVSGDPALSARLIEQFAGIEP